jgi:hypothetical protein
VDDVRSGAIDGIVVLLAGELVVKRLSCPDTDGFCPELSIMGLDLPVVAAPELVPWDRDPPAGATLVLFVASGSLTFLGAIPPDVRDTGSITALLDNRSRFLALADLYLVKGVLLANPSSCYAWYATQSAPPCEVTPLLLDPDDGAGPRDGPARGAAVSLAAEVVWQGDRLRTEGTFLVRRMYRPTCDLSVLPPGTRCDQQFVIRPQIVALVESRTALRVTMPVSGGIVSGQVVDLLGRPMVGLSVRVVHEDAALPTALDGRSTDADGRFSVAGVPAGTSRVEVVESWPDGDIIIGRVQVELSIGETLHVLVVATPGVAMPSPSPG